MLIVMRAQATEEQIRAICREIMTTAAEQENVEVSFEGPE